MHPEKGDETAQILFVCTGNTCRSALAEALARREIENRGWPWSVCSAGISTLDDTPASETAILVGREAGLDLSRHRARLLTRRMVVAAELILVLANSHRKYIQVLAPESMQRLHLLRAYATRDAEPGDVLDPIGGGVEIYRQTLQHLETLVGNSLERFAEDAKSQRH